MTHNEIVAWQFLNKENSHIIKKHKTIFWEADEQNFTTNYTGILECLTNLLAELQSDRT